MRPARTGAAPLLAACLLASTPAAGHGVADRTIRFEEGAPLSADVPHLLLSVRDAATGADTPARFELRVDDSPWVPPALGRGGLRVISAEGLPRDRRVVTYARGLGPVEVPLPPRARAVEVHVAKGFEFRPVTRRVTLPEAGGDAAAVVVDLERWVDLGAEGWWASDTHLHYDRLDPADDADWFTMMEGDGLAHAHLLTLERGALPGIWARQYAHGPEGQATRGPEWIRPGEELRDAYQGHATMLGIARLVHPITVGADGEHRPPLHDLLLEAREEGGVAGIAHGGQMVRDTTLVRDVVLGAADYVEVLNPFLWAPQLWYQLMNCGFVLPPVAGTDLPAAPRRDPHQPFLGSVRTYVRAGAAPDFAAWTAALRRGESFVSSGPVVRLRVAEVGPGGTVQLPAGGGDVDVIAELASPRPLVRLDIVRDGRVSAHASTASEEDGIWRLRIRRRLRFQESGWLAARGFGSPTTALRGIGGPDRELAHTAAVRVLVGGSPIASPAAAEQLRRELRAQRERYAAAAIHRDPIERARAQVLFERALERLQAP